MHASTDSEINTYANTIPPPPPYSGVGDASGQNYDLTPTPQSVNRPRLPDDSRRNIHLRTLPEDATIVKFQTIVREGREIVVGRIKVPIPGNNAHAFILRRYDTDAISLTTMYKVAFTGATEEDERREMEWVKSSFDTRNTNGGRDGEVVRLAGQWVSRHLAIHLAPAYGVVDLVAALARAVPDPNVAYRKSQRSQAAADELARHKTVPEPAAASNVPSLYPEAALPVPKRPRRASIQDQTSASSDDARHLTLEATTTVTAPAGAPIDMEAEIQSAKELVMNLKRELQMRNAAGEALEEQGIETGESSRGVKRNNGEGEVVIISGGAGKERIVRSNKRVVQSPVAETAKRVAWGALIFGLGVGAASLLPQISSAFF